MDPKIVEIRTTLQKVFGDGIEEIAQRAFLKSICSEF